MKTLGYITAFLLFTAFGCACSMLGAFVLRDFWNWFLVGPFILAPITWAQAYGLSLMAIFLKLKIATKSEEKEFGVALLEGCTQLVAWLIVAWFIWLIGAAFHAWVVH